MKAKQLMGVSKDADISDPTRDLKAQPKGVYADLSLEDRNDVAMNQINSKLMSEDAKVARFITDARVHEKEDHEKLVKDLRDELAATKRELSACRESVTNLTNELEKSKSSEAAARVELSNARGSD